MVSSRLCSESKLPWVSNSSRVASSVISRRPIRCSTIILESIVTFGASVGAAPLTPWPCDATSIGRGSSTILGEAFESSTAKNVGATDRCCLLVADARPAVSLFCVSSSSRAPDVLSKVYDDAAKLTEQFRVVSRSSNSVQSKPSQIL